MKKSRCSLRRSGNSARSARGPLSRRGSRDLSDLGADYAVLEAGVSWGAEGYVEQ